MDLWTSPSDRPTPCGPCGQPVDNAPGARCPPPAHTRGPLAHNPTGPTTNFFSQVVCTTGTRAFDPDQPIGSKSPKSPLTSEASRPIIPSSRERHPTSTSIANRSISPSPSHWTTGTQSVTWGLGNMARTFPENGCLPQALPLETNWWCRRHLNIVSQSRCRSGTRSARPVAAFAVPLSPEWRTDSLIVRIAGYRRPNHTCNRDAPARGELAFVDNLRQETAASETDRQQAPNAAALAPRTCGRGRTACPAGAVRNRGYSSSIKSRMTMPPMTSPSSKSRLGELGWPLWQLTQAAAVATSGYTATKLSRPLKSFSRT